MQRWANILDVSGGLPPYSFEWHKDDKVISTLDTLKMSVLVYILWSLATNQSVSIKTILYSYHSLHQQKIGLAMKFQFIQILQIVGYILHQIHHWKMPLYHYEYIGCNFTKVNYQAIMKLIYCLTILKDGVYILRIFKDGTEIRHLFVFNRK